MSLANLHSFRIFTQVSHPLYVSKQNLYVAMDNKNWEYKRDISIEFLYHRHFVCWLMFLDFQSYLCYISEIRSIQQNGKRRQN